MCVYFRQLTTELREPKRLAELMNAAELMDFTDGLEHLIGKVLEKEKLPSWLFLGTGTCLPLVKAAQLLQRRFAGAFASETVAQQVTSGEDSGKTEVPSGGEEERQQKPKSLNCRPITACSLFLSQPLGTSEFASPPVPCLRQTSRSLTLFPPF